VLLESEIVTGFENEFYPQIVVPTISSSASQIDDYIVSTDHSDILVSPFGNDTSWELKQNDWVERSPGDDWLDDGQSLDGADGEPNDTAYSDELLGADTIRLEPAETSVATSDWMEDVKPAEEIFQHADGVTSSHLTLENIIEFNDGSYSRSTQITEADFESSELNLTLKNNVQQDISLNFKLPTGIKDAYVELDVKDADSQTEGELWVNGIKAADLFPNVSGRNNNKWSTEAVFFDPSLLKNGENIFTFKHIQTSGFILDSLRVGFVRNPFNIKAFPGAEGFGTDTTGGRGGRIFAVTSLADSGPGTLREAIEASGPRMIVFHVGGTINLEKSINIRNPYITIAGQTAPGDGIQLAHAGLKIATHDVVIRGLRIRPGDKNRSVHDAIDPHGGRGAVRNLVIDHSSLSWGMDENIGLWDDVQDVTIQWSIISEGLYDSFHPSGPHSRGILVGDGIKNVALHHNLLAHNNRRNPELKGGTSTTIINNLLYNWGKHAILLADIDNDSGPLYANIIGNRAIAGPDTDESSSYSQHLVYLHRDTTKGSKFYVHDNLGPSRTSRRQPDWDSVFYYEGDPGLYRSEMPIPELETDITIHPVSEVKRLVLRYAGATAPRRDAVDKRIISDVRNGTGSLIDSQDDVGGWPVFRQRLRRDNDNDGLPNQWERDHPHLDPNNPDDANQDYNNDGYLNIEDYMNSFFEQPF
jgi:pectate lyase